MRFLFMPFVALLAMPAYGQTFDADSVDPAMMEEVRNIQSSVMIEWYAENCEVNISPEIIDRAVREVSEFPNRAAVSFSRNMYSNARPTLARRGDDLCALIEEEI